MRKILSKRISQVMSRKIVTLNPNDPVSKLKYYIRKYDYNAFPVVDGQKRYLGLVTKTDFLKIFAMGITVSRSKFYNFWAKDISELMTKHHDKISPGSKIMDAANLMVEHGYKAIPVVGRGNKLVGIITGSDIAKYTILELKKKK